VKRCLHRLGFTFRRARRVPPKAPPEPEQTRVRRTLSRLHRLEAAGRGQVWYGDESGFCLSPVVPYLWQKKGQTVGLPAQAHSRRLNVLGLMSRKGSLHSFPTQEKFTAQHLIQSLETLLPARVPTTVVLDNASVHRAKAVKEKQAEWRQKGLRVLFLPSYCPHLNKIEALWRMMKYRWLAPEAYADFQTLCQSVTDILAQVGTKYQLSFA